MIFERNDF